MLHGSVTLSDNRCTHLPKHENISVSYHYSDAAFYSFVVDVAVGGDGGARSDVIGVPPAYVLRVG